MDKQIRRVAQDDNKGEAIASPGDSERISTYDTAP